MKKINIIYLLIGIMVFLSILILIINRLMFPPGDSSRCTKYTLTCLPDKSAIVHCAVNGTGYDYIVLQCSNGTICGWDSDGDGDHKCLLPNEFNLTPQYLQERIINFFKRLSGKGNPFQ